MFPNLSQNIVLRLLPGFKSGHTRYVECVKEHFRDNCRWLDAGGGRRIFPDLYDGERDLVSRAGHVVICDADEQSLASHVSVSTRLHCDLTDIPSVSNSFDLVTCGMVVEHLADPSTCIRELGRVLDVGGKLIIHTVNLYSYPTLLAIVSKLLPYRTKLIAYITGRQEEDIFPTLYRCNTERRLKEQFKVAGLEIVELRHIDAGLLFCSFWPLALLECLYIRATRWPILVNLRGQLLVIATKARNG